MKRIVTIQVEFHHLPEADAVSLQGADGLLPPVLERIARGIRDSRYGSTAHEYLVLGTGVTAKVDHRVEED